MYLCLYIIIKLCRVKINIQYHINTKIHERTFIQNSYRYITVSLASIDTKL